MLIEGDDFVLRIVGKLGSVGVGWLLLERVVEAEGFHESVEVIEVVERDFDAAFVFLCAAGSDGDFGAEVLGESLFEVGDGGGFLCGLLVGVRRVEDGGRGVGVFGSSFEFADGPSAIDGGGCEFGACGGVVDGEECLGVSQGEGVGGDEVLGVVVEIEDSYEVCDAGAFEADALGDVGVVEVEVVGEALESVSAVDGVEVLAVDVFDERGFGGGAVVDVFDDDGDRFETCEDGGAPSAFAGDDFVGLFGGWMMG